MKTVILFSIFLIVGLVASQFSPILFGDAYTTFRYYEGLLLSVALSFIMINVGREFDLDKSKLKSYGKDYLVAMLTAAMPWILVCIYFMFLLPEGHFWEWESWKNNLLLSRFAAPTSAGILFAMLAAIGLKKSWVYSKVQTLAIFDDLDTILLMIPLQILMIGMHWELHIVLVVVALLLFLAWRYLSAVAMPQKWHFILLYAFLVVAMSEFIYNSSKLISDKGVHIEVLLPAFVLGVIMRTKHIHDKRDQEITQIISYVFMFLVGLSMPAFIGKMDMIETVEGAFVQPVLSWGEIAFHVVIVTLLSNLGKMVPVFFYKDRKLSERLAISIGMFTRGEVGAGIIFIAIGYNIGGPLLAISILTIVLNLILTGFFVLIVKKLALKSVEVGDVLDFDENGNPVVDESDVELVVLEEFKD